MKNTALIILIFSLASSYAYAYTFDPALAHDELKDQYRLIIQGEGEIIDKRTGSVIGTVTSSGSGLLSSYPFFRSDYVSFTVTNYISMDYYAGKTITATRTIKENWVLDYRRGPYDAEGGYDEPIKLISSTCVDTSPSAWGMTICNMDIFNPLNATVTAYDFRSNLNFTATANEYDLPYIGRADYDMNINYTMTEVPLPAAAWLFGSALLSLVAVRKNRIKH